MSFFNFFKNVPTEKEQQLSRLHSKIEELFPELDDEKRVELACIAGLLARVAFVDMEIHGDEMKKIESVLKDKFELDSSMAFKVAKLSVEEIKDLSVLENHLYAHPLNDIFDNNQKYKLLEVLFSVAAADGAADNEESEEIRNICDSLRLEHKHFVAARATVREQLSALKK